MLYKGILFLLTFQKKFKNELLTFKAVHQMTVSDHHH